MRLGPPDVRALSGYVYRRQFVTSAPAAARFVAYLRVSTDRQGRSGLGLEAQRAAVAEHAARAGGAVRAEFVEVESGRKNDRPQLAAALAACRAHRATLLIAKLDRLARNARFLLGVVEGSGEGGVVFCDLPQVPPGPVGKFLVTQMAAVAELEAGLISQRTRAALAAAKARGVRLGNPRLRAGTAEMAHAAAAARAAKAKGRAADVLPYLEQAKRAGARTLRELAAALAARGVPAPAGGHAWHPQQVRRVLAAAAAAARRRAPRRDASVARPARAPRPGARHGALLRAARCPDLLGGWALLREWGRVGSPGRVRADAFATEDAAMAALERLARRKRGRGYADSAAPPAEVNTDRPGRGRA
jgi:DNA invertase Pin-like site-specific DNA recombinase/predicted DNA-binding WGR domain protein